MQLTCRSDHNMLRTVPSLLSTFNAHSYFLFLYLFIYLIKIAHNTFIVMTTLSQTPDAIRTRRCRSHMSAIARRCAKLKRRVSTRSYHKRKRIAKATQAWRAAFTPQQRAEHLRKQREYARARRARARTARESETTATTADHRRAHDNASCRADKVTQHRISAHFAAPILGSVRHTSIHSHLAAHRAALAVARSRVATRPANISTPPSAALLSHTRKCLTRIGMLRSTQQRPRYTASLRAKLQRDETLRKAALAVETRLYAECVLARETKASAAYFTASRAFHLRPTRHTTHLFPTTHNVRSPFNPTPRKTTMHTFPRTGVG